MYLFGLVFILLVGVVNAVAPVTTVFSGGDSGISIEAPTMDNLVIGEAVDLHIHCFNSSTGKPLTAANSNVGCGAHLFYPNGTHLYDVPEASVDEDHWEIFISGNNITREGTYEFNIHCNDSNVGGFVTDYFEATEDGRGLSHKKDYALATILLLVGFAAIFSYLTIKFDYLPFRLFFLLCVFAMFVFSYQFLFHFFGTNGISEVAQSVAVHLKVSTWFFIVSLALAVVYIPYFIVTHWKTKGEEDGDQWREGE